MALQLQPYPLRKHTYAIYCDFFRCKNDNFQLNKFESFLIFAQNIDYGYTIEPPRLGGSNEYQVLLDKVGCKGV